MALLPVHPRLGRLLIEGQALGTTERAALAAALLSERDPFLRGGPPRLAAIVSDSDLLDRVEALEAFAQSGKSQFAIGELHRGGAEFVLRARDQLLRLLGSDRRQTTLAEPDALLRALLAAYPDRLARRRNPAGPRGIMVGGRGVKLLPSSHVTGPELFLCIDVDAGATESLVRMASGVHREWLSPDSLREETIVEFNSNSEKIEARRTLRFEDLLLETTPVLLPERQATASVLWKAAIERIERVQPGPETPAGQFLLRVRCLNEWLPELGLPAFDEPALHEMLETICNGCRSFDELRKADWLGIMQGRLSYAQLQMVEREAPEHFTVPSGSSITLTYEVGRPPLLAVRIQEMFGMAETPRIADSRIPVLLHLLAPNYRPQQVTNDLRSFWANTYPVVRKELRSRYPKHSWPEDPLQAEAVRGPKRRG